MNLWQLQSCLRAQRLFEQPCNTTKNVKMLLIDSCVVFLKVICCSEAMLQWTTSNAFRKWSSDQWAVNIKENLHNVFFFFLLQINSGAHKVTASKKMNNATHGHFNVDIYNSECFSRRDMSSFLGKWTKNKAKLCHFKLFWDNFDHNDEGFTQISWHLFLHVQ